MPSKKLTPKWGITTLAAVSCAAFLAGCGGGSSPAASSKPSFPKVMDLTVGSTSSSTSAISFLFHTIMSQKPEFYQKAGLNVKVVSVQMGQASALVQTQNPPVLEGSGQVTVAQGYTQGAKDVKIFMGELQKPAYFLVSGKNITKATQIKTIGIPSVYSASAINCEDIMKKVANYTKNNQYKMVLVGTSGARVAAVQAGKVDASCELLPYPQEYQDKYGLHILASAASALPYFGSGVWVYNTKWAQDPTHHEALVRLSEAALLADKWAFDPANKSAVISLVEKTFKIPAKYAQIFYTNEIGNQLYTPDGYIPKQAAQGDSQSMVQVGLAKTAPNPSQYYNWSILQEAAKRLGMTIRKPTY